MNVRKWSDSFFWECTAYLFGELKQAEDDVSQILSALLSPSSSCTRACGVMTRPVVSLFDDLWDGVPWHQKVNRGKEKQNVRPHKWSKTGRLEALWWRWTSLTASGAAWAGVWARACNTNAISHISRGQCQQQFIEATEPNMFSSVWHLPPKHSETSNLSRDSRTLRGCHGLISASLVMLRPVCGHWSNGSCFNEP